MTKREEGRWICPCGATLLSRRDCRESDDAILRHVAEAYLDDASGYCINEDDVVPFAWAFKTEAEQQHHWATAGSMEIGESPF